MTSSLANWLCANVDIEGRSNGFAVTLAGHTLCRRKTLSNAARIASKVREHIRSLARPA